MMKVSGFSIIVINVTTLNSSDIITLLISSIVFLTILVTGSALLIGLSKGIIKNKRAGSNGRALNTVLIGDIVIFLVWLFVIPPIGNIIEPFVGLLVGMIIIWLVFTAIITAFYMCSVWRAIGVSILLTLILMLILWLLLLILDIILLPMLIAALPR
ncbi:MAG TPA: hypothetical protein VKM55_27995 [Candidatus Lokiarchaeia archaeon]|nr:hypothetical protein [Candidatus Lokiarchaeia archaeon]